MIRIAESNEIFTILFVIGLALVAMAKLFYSKRFANFIYLPGNSKYLLIHTRDQKFLDRFDALLFSNLVISISIFLTICYKSLYGQSLTSIDILMKIIVAVASFILIKVLLERLIGSLFGIDALIDDYLFQKTSYKNYLGLLLIPLNAFFIYNETPAEIVILITLVAFFLINLIGLTVSFKVHQNVLKRNLFYFILYLCALEIAPYIIIYKLLQDFKIF
ncbi:MAG: DUF4271 domain-containing protein [Flavobacteriaceae bacterium]|nr:DUF4271 domain-containing protein [Mangrovimonas sp.]MCB0426236.1 DUF4271 domain-containing protein [Mangrovimonas sp.]MCB0437106.1 DUF4271 domain-containing protein [Mangrovimonas sp.]HPF97338.1 DUF4271 domain-containing protein [Mangrovimonas sp.]